LTQQDSTLPIYIHKCANKHENEEMVWCFARISDYP